MKQLKNAFIFNCLIVLLETVALLWMMCGNTVNLLTGTKLQVLKFFTVDSNILMGLAAIISALWQYRVLKKRAEEIPLYVKVLKLTATAGVTLTFFVTVFFLWPTTFDKYGPFFLFEESNFLFHLVNPVLSIIVFVLFEKTDQIKIKQTFFALLPILLYSIYYILITLAHTHNGVIESGYDWYGFFMFGPMASILIIVPTVFLISYVFVFFLWKLNRR